MRMFKSVAVLCLALAGSVSGSATAASLQVSPIRLDVPNTETSRPLWVSNTGTSPITVQIRVYKWDQANGEETLVPTTEVAATPAMTQVQPGQRQLVRIVRRGAGPTTEQAYRLRVEELPPQSPVLLQPGMPALNLLMAYSLPVFMGPEQTQDLGSLSAQVKGDTIVFENTGTRRVMISDLKTLDASGQEQLVRAGLIGYVLAGQTMAFPFQGVSGMTHVRATVDQNNVQDWSLSR